MPTKKNKTPWYITGLHFECKQCSQCCSGPGEGYIWVTKPEIKFIADFLKIPADSLCQKYLKPIGKQTTIVEHSSTKDCIFQKEINNRKGCAIYPVRPNQCRTWPFWSSNLTTPDDWNKTAQNCFGINRGRHHSYDEIEKIKNSKKWWKSNDTQTIKKEVSKIYKWLDSQIHSRSKLTGDCSACGQCCDFQAFDHKLFVSSPEMIYLTLALGDKNIKQMTIGRCPYNIDSKCTIYKYRFAGCRIFQCKGDADFQSQLSESALNKFKSLCNDSQIPYNYTDLATALNPVPNQSK